MQAGSAQPFMQPWYIPIACSPRETGMPMGGIGSAFTLTPAGTTPVISAVGGLHLTAKPEESIRLHSFFFGERRADAPLRVADAGGLLRRNRFAALLKQDGKPWLSGEESEAEVAQVVASMAAHPRLFQDNAEALQRWQIELSPRTREALAAGPSPTLSRALLLDVFGSSLELVADHATALTGDSEVQTLAGQNAYSAAEMSYQGLYPLAQTEFNSKHHALRLRSLAFTPMIAGDERWCSLPVSGTVFEIENPTAEAREATLVFTLENFIGDEVIKARPGVQDAWFYLVRTARYQRGRFVETPLGAQSRAIGFTLEQEPGQESGEIRGSMSALVEAPEAPGFWATATPTAYAENEVGLVKEALRTGRLQTSRLLPLATGRERGLGALCVTVMLPPGARREVTFSLALDWPSIDMHPFHSRKKYTEFYPEAAGRSEAMAADVLRDRPNLLARIAADHAASAQLGELPELLLQGKNGAPERLLTQLANTLGFLADATVWDIDDRFWIRECADYPFFNSLDVYFYGSFSVLRLLPRLDGCVLRDFAHAIRSDDPRRRRHWEYMHEPYADLPEERLEGPRGVEGAVPHDMGSPFDPSPDAYIWHNVKHWKDLAPKYLLLLWRHYRVTGDSEVLRACWPAARAAIDYLDKMRTGNSPIPLTNGTDDTFDNLESRGISIYCGSLWVAALAVGEALAKAMRDIELAEAWKTQRDQSAQALTAALWDDKAGYYHFWKDARDGVVNQDVFADQLLADLWLRLLQLPPLTPDSEARRAAQTVLALNYRRNSPWIGAANLVARDGSTLPAFQAQDVWLGVQHSLAATCAKLGLHEEAWDLLETGYRNLYDEARIPFGAPEGFNGSVVLTPEKLAAALEISKPEAKAWVERLIKAGLLSREGRPEATSRQSYPGFAAALGASGATPAEAALVPKLHDFLLSHGLQYTAGRYLRPGMIWALAWPMKKEG